MGLTIKEKNDSIYATNKYLQLRKNFNVVQKRTLHFVIKELQEEIYFLNSQKSEQKNLPEEKKKPFERTLFGDCYFNVPVKMIDPSNQDTSVRNSIKGLKISIDDENFIGDFMLSAIRKDGYWRLLFPEKTIHFLTDVSKGITPLQTLLYLSANSEYTIRMYEILMIFRNFGKFKKTPEDLIDELGAPETYKKNYNTLKVKILDPSCKELKQLFDKNQSDLYFTYKEKRGGRGNKVLEVIFSISWKENASKQIVQKKSSDISNDISFIIDNLIRIMVESVSIARQKKNRIFINDAVTKLIEKQQVSKFAEILDTRVLCNPNVNNKGALARVILKDEFNIE